MFLVIFYIKNEGMIIPDATIIRRLFAYVMVENSLRYASLHTTKNSIKSFSEKTLFDRRNKFGNKLFDNRIL